MANKHSSKQRVAGGLSVLLLGTLLAFVSYTWYNSGTDLSSNPIVTRHADVLGLQDRPDHLSNLTLERRQTFQCGPGNPCSNGACCGEGGYCGYGESSVKASMNLQMELMLNRLNVLWQRLRF